MSSSPVDTPARTMSQDSDSLRKRVCKACDRCRLKKSKCDGSSPCTRCKADNAICVFGERKKSHDKVYPKGYVEMLEQQQAQLVSGLQETYRRMVAGQIWPGQPLPEAEGHPLTHDILTRLEILLPKHDDEDEQFEENCDRMQQRLLAQGAQYIPRRGSFSSDSEHSQTTSRKRARPHDATPPSPHTTSSAATPVPASAPAQKHTRAPRPVFKDGFGFMSATSTPLQQSPVQTTFPRTTKDNSRSNIKPSPLHTESPVIDSVPDFDNEPELASWQGLGIDNSNSYDLMRSSQPTFQTQQWMPSRAPTSLDDWQNFDPSLQFDPSSLTNMPLQTPNYNLQHWTNDSMDLDFSKYIQVAAM